jgi:hypothetical protein
VWNNIDGKSFRVRQGPDYPRHKKKAGSAEPLYECQLVRIYSSPRKVLHIGGKTDVPKEAAACAGLALPGCIVVSWLLPDYAPSLFKTKTEGEGHMKVMYFVLTANTQHILRTTPPDDFPPAIKLLLNIINNSPTPTAPKGPSPTLPPLFAHPLATQAARFCDSQRTPCSRPRYHALQESHQDHREGGQQKPATAPVWSY